MIWIWLNITLTKSFFWKFLFVIVNGLRQTIVMDDEEYKNKMELGKTIYENVKEYNINKESVCKEFKEPLYLYMKQKKKMIFKMRF